jgi:hypothetical protein
MRRRNLALPGTIETDKHDGLFAGGGIACRTYGVPPLKRDCEGK